jgi:hypothetical protein
MMSDRERAMRDELTDNDFDEMEVDDWEEDEYESFDCHMGRDGLCGAAGSEECDFECPYMRDIIAEENAKEKRKVSK